MSYQRTCESCGDTFTARYLTQGPICYYCTRKRDYTEISDDIRDWNYWPKKLPAREKMRLALWHLRRPNPLGVDAIGKRSGVNRHRLRLVMANPDRYDPVDDEIAIERAMSGDRTVLPRLTYYERVTLRERLLERIVAEPAPHRVEDCGDWWLHVLADAWGADVQLMRDRLNATASRRSRRAAA